MIIIINRKNFFHLTWNGNITPTRRIAMNEKIKSFLEIFEKTMACVAYAEAGEACPIDVELKESKKLAGCMMSVRDAMACSAYAEAGIPCPMCEGA